MSNVEGEKNPEQRDGSLTLSVVLWFIVIVDHFQVRTWQPLNNKQTLHLIIILFSTITIKKTIDKLL